MKIEDALPFAECYGCNECILDVKDELILFAEDRPVGKVIRAGCKNENKCVAMIAKEGRTMRYALQE